MASATIAPHILAITGMTGDECVTKVTRALKGVNGVTTQQVKVGSATIESDDANCRAACSAINNSGYKAKENAAQTSDSDIELAPEVPSAEHKGRNQSGAPTMGAGSDSIGPAGPRGNGKPDNNSNNNQPKPFGKSN